MEEENSNGLKIELDISLILQGAMVFGIVGIVGLMIQMRQDIALLREQMSNVVAAKEFAGFRSTTELQDIDHSKRLEKLEREIDQLKQRTKP